MERFVNFGEEYEKNIKDNRNIVICGSMKVKDDILTVKDNITKEEVKVLTDAYIMNNELSKLGIGKKYYIMTYGCQANERDSETT